LRPTLRPTPVVFQVVRGVPAPNFYLDSGYNIMGVAVPDPKAWIAPFPLFESAERRGTIPSCQAKQPGSFYI